MAQITIEDYKKIIKKRINWLNDELKQAHWEVLKNQIVGRIKSYEIILKDLEDYEFKP